MVQGLTLMFLFTSRLVGFIQISQGEKCLAHTITPPTPRRVLGGTGQACDRNCAKLWTPWMLLAPHQAPSSSFAYSEHAFCCLGAPHSRSRSPLPSSAAHSLNNKGGADTLRAGHGAATLPWGIALGHLLPYLHQNVEMFAASCLEEVTGEPCEGESSSFGELSRLKPPLSYAPV